MDRVQSSQGGVPAEHDTQTGSWSSQPSASSLLTDLRYASNWVDLACILAVPLVLVTVFMLPTPVKQRLVLDYVRPTVLTAYASHFVHFAPGHFVANLLAYGVIVPFVYAYSVLTGRRRHFFVVLGTFLLVFPFALSALNVALVRPRVGYGFSGIIMLFLGVLPLTLVWYLDGLFPEGFNVDLAPVFFFLGEGLIAVTAVPASPLSIGIALVAVLISLGYLRDVLECVGGGGSIPSPVGYSEFAIAGGSVYFLFIAVTFVPSPAEAGQVMNSYLHLLGYCVGFIVPFVAFRVVDVTDRDPARGTLPD